MARHVRRGMSTPVFSATVAAILLGSFAVRGVVRWQTTDAAPRATRQQAVVLSNAGSLPFQRWVQAVGGGPQEAVRGPTYWAVLGSLVHSVDGLAHLDLPAWSRLPFGVRAISVLVKIGDSPTRWVHTNATNVSQLLAAMDVSIRPDDRVLPLTTALITPAMTVAILRTRQATVTTVQKLPFETITRSTTAIPVGQTRIVQTGEPGQVLRTFLMTYRDGRRAAKKLLSEVVLTDAVPQVVEKGVSASSQSSYVPPIGSGGASAAVAAAYQAIGVPYVNGGASLSGFDCSGLTMWAWAHGGVSLPHSASAQYAATRRVSSSDLQPGDLVFFYSPISHVAIYVGGGMMIMAHKTGTYVQLDPMSSYWWGVYSGAGRP
jgi:cell wall-associated NlpC family hydrolase